VHVRILAFRQRLHRKFSDDSSYPAAVDRAISGSDMMDEKPGPMQRVPRKDSDVRIRYSILQRPSIPECLVLGFQHYLTMLGSTVRLQLNAEPHCCVLALLLSCMIWWHCYADACVPAAAQVLIPFLLVPAMGGTTGDLAKVRC